MRKEQTTDTILLVRPKEFRLNEQTSTSNYFQKESSLNDQQIAKNAQIEFDNFVAMLRENGVNALVLQDEGTYNTPDSIFPNNCVSFHGDLGIIYPMLAINRRRERKLDYFRFLEGYNMHFKNQVDYSYFEEKDLFLEGTGCLILDRINKVAYCSLSPRADREVVELFAKDLGYSYVLFRATQTVAGEFKAIYHTNVMMSVGNGFAVVCMDSIRNVEEKRLLEEALQQYSTEVIAISEEQMNRFCGNILQIHNKKGEPLIAMSTQAFEAFTSEQIERLNQYGKLIHSPLDGIERSGGGSARCMMAEVFHGAG